jgi:hypothetical protein
VHVHAIDGDGAVGGGGERGWRLLGLAGLGLGSGGRRSGISSLGCGLGAIASEQEHGAERKGGEAHGGDGTVTAGVEVW